MKNKTSVLWDVLAGLPSVILIAIGIWQIHRPSSLIFLGLVIGAAYILHELKR